ncbi:MAG: winged helix DNA-binding protein [Solirubrobacterales bacterium]|nr:winged helix DNA-binding protein [Solirubrobacterales bacterium]
MLGGLSVAITDLVAAGSRQAALVALDSHSGVSVAHLSRALGRSHSATVRLVDGLARVGLVARETAEDPRAVALALTDAGREAAGEVRRARAMCLDALVDTLSDAEVIGLEQALEQLLAATARDADSRWRTCRLCEEHRCEDGQSCPVDRAAPR